MSGQMYFWFSSCFSRYWITMLRSSSGMENVPYLSRSGFSVHISQPTCLSQNPESAERWELWDETDEEIDKRFFNIEEEKLELEVEVEVDRDPVRVQEQSWPLHPTPTYLHSEDTNPPGSYPSKLVMEYPNSVFSILMYSPILWHEAPVLAKVSQHQQPQPQLTGGTRGFTTIPPAWRIPHKPRQNNSYRRKDMQRRGKKC